MSLTEWIPIKSETESLCKMTRDSITFNEITRDDFPLADEFSRNLNRQLDVIFGFIEKFNLSSSLNISSIRSKYNRMQEISGGFGTGLPGIGQKHAAILMLINQIDSLFMGELAAVEKVEHALVVLDRKLLLFDDFQAKWKTAFDDKTEPELEKMGGFHLLEHGIWGFKVSAQRGETDLILQQNIGDDTLSSPMVMTEWKKYKDGDSMDNKIEEAKTQCEIYESGTLKPLQLDKHRFIIIVSLKKQDIEKTIEVGSKKYFVRNIAIERATPSAEARSGGQSS